MLKALILIALIQTQVQAKDWTGLVAASIATQKTSDWQTVVVSGTVIELPVIKIAEYERVAPANYKMSTPTKITRVWCPYSPKWKHGFTCGMKKFEEDLAGHLQETHKLTLEAVNKMGRGGWQDHHDDLHWCEDPPERQEKFLHPAPAVEKPGCASGNCPNGNCPTQSSGLFKKWR